MNERIRELAEQAGYNGHYAAEEFDVEKFAELIVEECAYIAGGYFGPGRSPKQAIFEHFGVEK